MDTRGKIVLPTFVSQEDDDDRRAADGRTGGTRCQPGCTRPGRLSLTASGPIDIDVEYVARALDEGSDVRAQIAVAGRGVRGRLLAAATDALLAAGALRASMARIARELEPAFG
ncbi:MAG TPA: hypothetical protein VHW04_07975 [Solirubrobacteraceae bacterium]|nr:hypothetical protein [Solirubrobacteraceae bacterium]